MGSCIPQENPKHIIVWKNPQHNHQEMNTLRVIEIKQQGTYITLITCWWGHTTENWAHKGHSTIRQWLGHQTCESH